MRFAQPIVRTPVRPSARNRGDNAWRLISCLVTVTCKETVSLMYDTRTSVFDAGPGRRPCPRLRVIEPAQLLLNDWWRENGAFEILARCCEQRGITSTACVPGEHEVRVRATI